MITPSTIWAFLIGAILGMVIVGLLLKVRLTQKAAEAIQTCKSELAVLEERIRAKELSYDHMLIKNQEMEKEVDRLRDTLIQEGQEKVAALKELEQLPEVKNSPSGPGRGEPRVAGGDQPPETGAGRTGNHLASGAAGR